MSDGKKLPSFITIGSKVFIRTVTHYYVGEVAEATDDFIVLTKATWVADTGHFGSAMKSGRFAQAEAYPVDMPVAVSRGALVDVCSFNGEL